MFGAERGWGTMRRGSGLAAGGAATTGGAAGLATGLAAGVAAATGFAGTCGWRASSSSSFFFASTAFSTSPGLEICERSIFGVIAGAAPREPAAPEWAPDLDPCAKCTRTFSASSSSSELEWVFPAPRPSSAKISRTCRLLTSNSRARSLIRTLLIRLFSGIPFPMHLVAHGYLVTMVVFQTCVMVQFTSEECAHGYAPSSPSVLPISFSSASSSGRSTSSAGGTFSTASSAAVRFSVSASSSAKPSCSLSAAARSSFSA
jgi:hypothetical protein